MDLHCVDTYLRPTTLDDLGPWQPDWAWLAGGTWLFTEPQPQVRTLVDLQALGWDECHWDDTGLTLGATYPMARLMEQDSAHSPALTALQRGVQELASFKVQATATVVGNLCLALPAGTFAPVMVLLDAEYELWTAEGDRLWIPAHRFQLGPRQTILQPGDVVRRIRIPARSLPWTTSYHRFCTASAGLAIALVTAAYDPTASRVRFCIGASVGKPYRIDVPGIPTGEDLGSLLDAQVPSSAYLQDTLASADYRRHLTQVLMGRALADLPC
jgi:CO/xanthine dehydrogenase FAD-binding subunit